MTNFLQYKQFIEEGDTVIICRVGQDGPSTSMAVCPHTLLLTPVVYTGPRQVPPSGGEERGGDTGEGWSSAPQQPHWETVWVKGMLNHLPPILPR